VGPELSPAGEKISLLLCYGERKVNMKTGIKIALFTSLFVLIGFPIIFTVISLLIGDWKYLFYSLPGSFTAGFTGLIVALKHIRDERKTAER
jgi:hypothetical protein